MPRGRSAPAPAASRAAPRSKPASSSSSSYAAPPPPQPAQSGGGWFGSRPSAPPPAPASSAPPPAAYAPSSGGGMMSGLLGSVVQGAALGTGSAMAHRAVDSMMGPRETRVVHEHQDGPVAPAPAAPMMAHQSHDGPCGDSVRQFSDCMVRYNGDMGACEPYFKAMQACKTQFSA